MLCNNALDCFFRGRWSIKDSVPYCCPNCDEDRLQKRCMEACADTYFCCEGVFSNVNVVALTLQRYEEAKREGEINVDRAAPFAAEVTCVPDKAFKNYKGRMVLVGKFPKLMSIGVNAFQVSPLHTQLALALPVPTCLRSWLFPSPYLPR